MVQAAQPSPSSPGVKVPVQTGFTGYQKFVVAALSFLQFTVILDFMILSPLGALLMPDLRITPAQFGMVVSAYAFSAGLSGILAAGFADRFDRKRLLLVFYCGFVLGTLFCGLAASYEALLLARIVTGLFGGVLGSITFAITTDLFPYSMRGRVMGYVQTAFGASQILGIPLGLWCANTFNWHAPFLMVVAVSVVVGAGIFFYLKPVDGHLQQKTERNAFHHLWATVRSTRHLKAFATTALMATGGFMLMPFGSDFSVHNVGIDLDSLPLVYVVTGLTAIVAGPLVGRASDRFGKFHMFLAGTLLTIVMVLTYTHLGRTPLAVLMIVNSLMFIGITARMIPSQALMSAVPSPANRGAFMAISNSVQQMAGGLAAVLAGAIVERRPDGGLEHFDRVGYVVIVASLFTLLMMWMIQRWTAEGRESASA